MRRFPRKAVAVMKASFREKGQAKLDRLEQDEMQKVCTEYAPKLPPKDAMAKIEKANLATIKWPADGKYLGDWQQWREDRAGGARHAVLRRPEGSGGWRNCYACHQLAPQELSYGTIGPSLYQFAKIARLRTETSANTRTARSTTPMPTAPAPTCRASATMAS